MNKILEAIPLLSDVYPAVKRASVELINERKVRFK